MEEKIRVLLSKLGLDVHNRGIITVAKELVNAGMEIIYIGNALPKQIISSAIQEGVDVVGVSSLGGAHLSLGSHLIESAKNEGLTDKVVFVIGGVFPPADAKTLQEIGFDGIFTPGADQETIVSSIKQLVKDKKRSILKLMEEEHQPQFCIFSCSVIFISRFLDFLL